MSLPNDSEKTIGLRCHICTGCGRCGGIGTGEAAPAAGGRAVAVPEVREDRDRDSGGRGLRVITADRLQEGKPEAGGPTAAGESSGPGASTAAGERCGADVLTAAGESSGPGASTAAGERCGAGVSAAAGESSGAGASTAAGERCGAGVSAAAGKSSGAGALPDGSGQGARLVAADIGTTTIALRLYRQDGTATADYVCVNPQVKYGADVLSRIQAAEVRGAREDMRQMVLREIESALREFASYLEPGEYMRMVLAGNTTMIYLLCGFDPAELGRAPFHASRLQVQELEIGGVSCCIFPGQSAFVGGDITAGIYACGMRESEEPVLLIDLGTNGELVLGNREKMIACATAAGPAFEGGVNRGIWGADMVSILARMLKEGVMDETGLLSGEYFENGVRIHDVCVTQGAIRAVQLAKAAIAAGIRILAEEYGIKDLNGIGRAVLAGGFGYYLKPDDAAAIGLLPSELARRAVAGGNTALSGGLRAGRAILRAEGAEKNIFAEMEAGGPWKLEILNLAAHPDFEKWYIDAMNF